MKFFLTIAFLFVSVLGFAQTKEENRIRKILADQTEAWNRGDIKDFMKTYWNSDSLLFIGKSGVNRGWLATLENYKKGYPDTAAMGKLSFDLLEIRKISPEYYFVVGKWMLDRSIGNVSGHYSLLIRKIKGSWYIVADHSS